MSRLTLYSSLGVVTLTPLAAYTKSIMCAKKYALRTYKGRW